MCGGGGDPICCPVTLSSLDLKESGWGRYWCANNLIYANWWILSIGNWLTLRHALVAALVMHWWGAPPPHRSPALRQIKFIRPSIFSRLPSIRIIASALTPNRPVPARPWSLPRTSTDELKLWTPQTSLRPFSRHWFSYLAGETGSQKPGFYLMIKCVCAYRS